MAEFSPEEFLRLFRYSKQIQTNRFDLNKQKGSVAETATMLIDWIKSKPSREIAMLSCGYAYDTRVPTDSPENFLRRTEEAYTFVAGGGLSQQKEEVISKPAMAPIRVASIAGKRRGRPLGSRNKPKRSD